MARRKGHNKGGPNRKPDDGKTVWTVFDLIAALKEYDPDLPVRVMNEHLRLPIREIKIHPDLHTKEPALCLKLHKADFPRADGRFVRTKRPPKRIRVRPDNYTPEGERVVTHVVENASVAKEVIRREMNTVGQPVAAYLPDGTFVARFRNASEASLCTGASIEEVSASVRGVRFDSRVHHPLSLLEFRRVDPDVSPRKMLEADRALEAVCLSGVSGWYESREKAVRRNGRITSEESAAAVFRWKDSVDVYSRTGQFLGRFTSKRDAARFARCSLRLVEIEFGKLDVSKDTKFLFLPARDADEEPVRLVPHVPEREDPIYDPYLDADVVYWK